MTTMQRLIAAAVLGIIIILGGLTYTTFRAPEQADAPIAAIPVAGAAAQPTSEVTTTTASDAATTTTSSIVAQIVQSESEARFVIDEVLNNAPKTAS